MDSIRVIVQRDDDGTLRVLAPGVGLWHAPPPPGRPLGPGSPLGTLSRLGRRFELVLPEAQGRVVDPPRDRRTLAVEYGQLLFRLEPLAAGLGETRAPEAETAGAGTDPVEGLVVVAPTDGTFYQRPSPEAAPYVEVGRAVRRGQVVGLVEVMKTFNQILFDGPGRPDEAVVVELRAADGEEVRAGQTLVVLEA